MSRGLSRSVTEVLSPRLIVWLGVILVAVGVTYGLIGPLGGWFWQTGPVDITINNSANQTYMFEVSVVEYPSNATVRRDDGLTGTYRIGSSGLSTHSPGENYTYTSVELHGLDRLHGRYTLEPGEQRQNSIEEFADNHAVVVVIYRSENEIVSWVSALCSGNLPFLEVTMYEHGPGSAYYC